MGHWTLNAAEDTLDRLEGEKATLDGENDELADDLQKAVQLLERAYINLIDVEVEEAIERFLDHYDTQYRPEETDGHGNS